MNDTTARSPEFNAVLACGRLEEIKDLLVAHDRALRNNNVNSCNFAREIVQTLRSASAPEKAEMRWSQWMEVGTAVVGLSQVENCNSAI